MNASFSYTWTEEFGNLYFNNRFGTAVPAATSRSSAAIPSNPNEQTYNEFTNWNAKFSGTVDAGWGLRVTPVLKMQSGAPYGRFFSTAPASSTTARRSSWSSRSARAGRTRSSVLDFRVEKQLRFAAERAQARSVLRPVQRAELEHRGQHQLALGRGVREGDDGARTAHREVRREVRLVSTTVRGHGGSWTAVTESSSRTVHSIVF